MSPTLVRLPRGVWVLAPAVAAAAFVLRTWNIHQHFWMLGDQIRDWTIALRPFGELPLVGPATHVGGYTIGPAFYWILWTLRQVFGPPFDNLPHAGGIGQAALQSAVDGLLLVAVWRRFGSPWLALATVTLVVTGPLDLALAPLVWNPVVGSTLAKAAIALVLLDWHRRGPAAAAVLVAIAWCAVHAYTGAIFVAVAVLALLLLDPLFAGDRRRVARHAAIVAVTIGLLQVPYLVHQVRHRFGAPAMGAVTGSVAEVISGSRPPEIRKSVDGYVGAVRFIQVAPWRVPQFGWVLLACGAIVAIRCRHDPAVLAITLLPAALAIAGYSLFLAELDDYYYLSLMPGAVLTVLLALTAVPGRQAARAAGLVVLALALVLVPARVQLAWKMHRMPEYGALVKGSRTVAARAQPMRAIVTEFPLRPTVDPEFLFRILGGTIDRSTPWTAVIDRHGRVRYEDTRRR